MHHCSCLPPKLKIFFTYLSNGWISDEKKTVWPCKRGCKGTLCKQEVDLAIPIYSTCLNVKHVQMDLLALFAGGASVDLAGKWECCGVLRTDFPKRDVDHDSLGHTSWAMASISRKWGITCFYLRLVEDQMQYLALDITWTLQPNEIHPNDAENVLSESLILRKFFIKFTQKSNPEKGFCFENTLGERLRSCITWTAMKTKLKSNQRLCQSASKRIPSLHTLLQCRQQLSVTSGRLGF